MPWGWRGGWAPYVPVAQRQAQAERQMNRLRKKGVDVQPVRIEGSKIARTFWGEAWCGHLEAFSDFANRLPRGRTYVRNGSVCHLQIDKGKVSAMVSGSSLYDIKVLIKTLPKKKWNNLKKRCAGQVGSLLELLGGRLSDNVMGVVTDHRNGLFPLAKEIQFSCSCPDWAYMCKHVVAVLYGVGARLDQNPELLFKLRGVDHAELVSTESARSITARAAGRGRRTLKEDRIADVFGIDLTGKTTEESVEGAAQTSWAGKRRRRKAAGKKAAKSAPGKKSRAKRAGTSAKKKPAGKARADKRTARATSKKAKKAVRKKLATKASGKNAAPRDRKRATPKASKKKARSKKSGKSARKTTRKD